MMKMWQLHEDLEDKHLRQKKSSAFFRQMPEEWKKYDMFQNRKTEAGTCK